MVLNELRVYLHIKNQKYKSFASFQKRKDNIINKEHVFSMEKLHLQYLVQLYLATVEKVLYHLSYLGESNILYLNHFLSSLVFINTKTCFQILKYFLNKLRLIETITIYSSTPSGTRIVSGYLVTYVKQKNLFLVVVRLRSSTHL